MRLPRKRKKLLTINIPGDLSTKEVNELHRKFWDFISDEFDGYTKYRVFTHNSVEINFEELEAWLKSRSYHE